RLRERRCNVISPGSNLEVHVKTALTEMFGILHPIIQGGMHYVGFALSGGLRIITGLTQKPRTHRARGAGASGFSQLAARAPRAATRPQRRQVRPAIPAVDGDCHAPLPCEGA